MRIECFNDDCKYDSMGIANPNTHIRNPNSDQLFYACLRNDEYLLSKSVRTYFSGQSMSRHRSSCLRQPMFKILVVDIDETSWPVHFQKKAIFRLTY
jgi:hypothetical protein